MSKVKQKPARNELGDVSGSDKIRLEESAFVGL